MSHPWLRLWTDMPTDPKWRTIARLSGQSISSVISVYIFVLINASNATERGRTQNLISEDIASALDVDTSAVDAILAQMEGRVMEKGGVTGWAKRQPIREDNGAERAKAWRERNRTQPNAANAPEETRRDTEADKEEKKEQNLNPPANGGLDTGNKREKKQPVPLPASEVLQEAGLKPEDYESYMAVRKAKKQAFVDERARDKWIAKWKGYFVSGLDTAAMFDLMISSGWIGPVEDKWTKRKIDRPALTEAQAEAAWEKEFALMGMGQPNA